VPDAAHEALRDLVRAREVAKKDQLRARHRLGKFLLRRGLRAAAGVRSWTASHLLWVKTLRFEHAAQEATFVDYLHEVDHAAERVARLEGAIDQAVESMPAEMRAVIAGLQALRGIRKVSAATIVAEVGPLTRFSRPKQLMGYSGMVSRARTRRAAACGAERSPRRATPTSAASSVRPHGHTSKEIAWKAQHRLCSRYRRLLAKGKIRQKVATAIGRELLGFIWAIGTQVEKEQRSTKDRSHAA